MYEHPLNSPRIEVRVWGDMQGARELARSRTEQANSFDPYLFTPVCGAGQRHGPAAHHADTSHGL